VEEEEEEYEEEKWWSVWKYGSMEVWLSLRVSMCMYYVLYACKPRRGSSAHAASGGQIYR
jgi:hypothetical protein